MKNYVLVGDIHSQYHQLLSALDFIKNNITDFYLICLGDIFDSRTKYSNSVDVYKTLRNLENNGKAIVLQSNHQDKYIRFLKGNQITPNNGLDRTIEDFSKENISTQEILNWLETFPYGIAFKDSSGLEYRCSHAYFSSKFFVPSEYKDEYLIHIVSKTTKSKCIYGPIQENIRIQWWNSEEDQPWIRVAGHYHKVHIDLEKTKSIILDGGCGNDEGKLYIYDVNQQQIYFF